MNQHSILTTSDIIKLIHFKIKYYYGLDYNLKKNVYAFTGLHSLILNN